MTYGLAPQLLLGILSDIHGRYDALEVAYAAAASTCDKIVCLGDIVNGGGDADACINFFREQEIPTVRGNHDDSWLAMCSFSEFNTPNYQYMKALPTWLRYEGLILVHEDPALANDTPDDFLGLQGYINTQEQATKAFNEASVFSKGPCVVAIGHTHIPAVFTDCGAIELAAGVSVKLPGNACCIINPGSVGGRARSRWGNTFATFDTKSLEFTVIKLNLPQLDDPWENLFQRIVY